MGRTSRATLTEAQADVLRSLVEDGPRTITQLAEWLGRDPRQLERYLVRWLRDVGYATQDGHGERRAPTGTPPLRWAATDLGRQALARHAAPAPTAARSPAAVLHPCPRGEHGGRPPRGARRAAILALIRERGQATDRELAKATGLSKTQVGEVRRPLVEEGLVEAVPAPEGSHYPTAGWRVVAGAPSGGER